MQQFIVLLESSEHHCWFQQGGAPAHNTVQTTFEILHEFFDDHIIASSLWPPRSPDMTLPDFFCGLI